MRRLLVNADDFGWDDETLRATVALIDRGWVTSATIMTARPATAAATEVARTAGPTLSFGLHFNIVDGHTASGGAPNSLTDRQGRFRPSHYQRFAALAGLLRPRDVADELRAQLRTLFDAGVLVTHVDSHGHLHKFPAVARAMAPVLRDFGIDKVRRPQNLHARRAPLDLVDVYCTARFPATWTTTDHFHAIDARQPNWLRALPDLMPDGTTEISVHPGLAEAWRRRECAMLVETPPDVVTACGIAFVCYRDVPG